MKTRFEEDDFSKPKIAWASVGETFYSYDECGYILLDTNYFLVGENIKYLLGLFNSRLFTWIINTSDTPIGNGGAYRHYRYNIESIHIPLFYCQLEEVVDIMLCGKKSEEKAVDKIVYDLYGLNDDEIKFIESQ